MRTKKLLLTAALSAAGIASSMGQVYSVNTVGYVNVVAKGNAYFTLVSNPLDDGNGNQLTNVLAALPLRASVQVWNGSGFNGASKSKGGAFSGWTTNMTLAVGQGFFVQLAAGDPDFTNTFVGTVIPAAGGTNDVPLPNGLFVLDGSVLPVAGTLGEVGGPGTLNLGPSLPLKSSVQVWDNTGASPGTFVGSSKSKGGAFAGWNLNLPLSVGQGFFINSGGTNASPAVWEQILPPNAP